jgi:hypothetical protein
MIFKGYNFRHSRKVVDLPSSVNEEYGIADNFIMFGRVCDSADPEAVLTTWTRNGGGAAVYAKVVPVKYHSLTNMMLGKDNYWYALIDGKCYVNGEKRKK